METNIDTNLNTEIEANLDVLILKQLKDAQNQHGLKYENYQRYRSYCSRRLHRLRRSINVRQNIPATAKARHQRARKMIDITPSMVVEAGDYGERVLLILLYLTERAWAYAMQLKQEVSEDPRKKYHMVRRLRKAYLYSNKFESLCLAEDSPCSESTKTEAQAYVAYISSLYHFEKEDWVQAQAYLTKALNIYFRLNIWNNYQDRIAEIKASLKYCNFNLGVTVSKQSDLPKSIKFHDIAYKHVLATTIEDDEDFYDACE